MRRNLQAVGLSVMAAVLLVFSSGVGFTLRHCLHSGTTRAELAWLAEAPPCLHTHDSEAEGAHAHEGESTEAQPNVPACCCRNLAPECCAKGVAGVCPEGQAGVAHKPCCDLEFRLFQLEDYAQLSADGFSPLVFNALWVAVQAPVVIDWPHPAHCTARGAPPEPPPPLAVGRGALVRHQVFRL